MKTTPAIASFSLAPCLNLDLSRQRLKRHFIHPRISPLRIFCFVCLFSSFSFFFPSLLGKCPLDTRKLLHVIPSARDTRNSRCHQANFAVSAALSLCLLAHLLSCSCTLQLEPHGMLFHCFYVTCFALVLCFSRCSAALRSSTLRSPALF